ncbi:unnamed protein product, partial [Cuscuta campestris]
MTVGCPTGADVKTPVFGPSEGMTGMAEAIFGPNGVTIVAVAAVGPITAVGRARSNECGDRSGPHGRTRSERKVDRSGLPYRATQSSRNVHNRSLGTTPVSGLDSEDVKHWTARSLSTGQQAKDVMHRAARTLCTGLRGHYALGQNAARSLSTEPAKTQHRGRIAESPELSL